MNLLISLTIFLYFSSISFSQQIGQIGNGTRNIVATPAYGLYDYTQSGMIYLASELESIGVSSRNSITAIEFEFEGWRTNYALNDQLIKISHIKESSFNSTEYPDYRSLNVTNTTIVKNTFDWRAPANEDWEVFNFDTPFIWNGEDNILI